MGASLGVILVAVGCVGLFLASITTGGPPSWVWLTVMGGGLLHSIAWRAASVRRANAKERRRHAVRLRNAERRERKHLKATLANGRRMRKVLAEVREHPGMEWAHTIAATVRGLQAEQDRHASALVHYKMLAQKTASDLSGLVDAKLSDDE
jgi:hypothetical protein